MLHTLPDQLVCLVVCKASYWPAIQRVNRYIRECIEYERGLCARHGKHVPRPVLSDFMFCKKVFQYAVGSLGAHVTLASLRVGMRRWKDSGACDLHTLFKACTPFAISTAYYSLGRGTNNFHELLLHLYAAYECGVAGNRELMLECARSAAANNICLDNVIWYAFVAHHGVDYAKGLQCTVSHDLPLLRFRTPAFNSALFHAVWHNDAVTLQTLFEKQTLFETYDVNHWSSPGWDMSKDLVRRRAVESKADACLEVMKRYNY